MEGLLYLGCSRYCIRCPREDGKAAVPLPTRAHQLTAMPTDYLFDYPVMANEGRACGFWIALPKLSASLYVGEEEGYGAGW